ncbi:ribosome silencing factor [Thalassotalea sediminis]|uniref:ribosome silencing factor n=1 Tax=Thalassotalea sediminis TaxID=1759089 RepID=UPI0025748CAA|nr:ribosome silencing factor [Thalassotalea sediminis]
MQIDAIATFVVDKIDDLKGRDITSIDIREKSDIADYMIVASGNSTRHVKSIAQHVVMECRTEGVEPIGIEGNDIGEWCLVDLGDVIVHIMTDEIRDMYQLEQLWEA